MMKQSMTDALNNVMSGHSNEVIDVEVEEEEETSTQLPVPFDRGQLVQNSQVPSGLNEQMLNTAVKTTDKQLKLLGKVFNNINSIKERNEAIRYQNYLKDFEYNQFIQNVKNIHNDTMNYAALFGIYIWKSYTGSTRYYRINPFSKREKIATNDDLRSLFKIHIKIYDSIEEVQIYDNTLILVNGLLSSNKYDAFYPYINFEFFIQNNINYRNTFQYTYFLEKRFTIMQKQQLEGEINQLLLKQQQSYPTFQSSYFQNQQMQPQFQQPTQIQYIQPPSIQEQIQQLDQQLGSLHVQLQIQKSIIEDFIRFSSQDDNQFNYIMNWLAYFFQTLNKSNIALVLIGDTEVTDILVSKIIRPIFAAKKEYFSSINDDTLKKTNETIIKDKIFYHIDELSTTNTKDRRTGKLVLEILKSNPISSEYALENNETYIYGQLLITSSKDTPYPFLKDIYSRCTVFKAKHLDTVLKKLTMDRIDFEDMVQNDLNNFSNILAQYSIHNDYFNVIPTDEKNALPTMKNGILKTPRLNNKVQQFIDKIRVKNLSYFENVKKEDPVLYEELEHNFSEDMIAQRLLSNYFNLIYDDIIFSENSYLLEILKEKSEMFNKAPDDKSKYNGKKRYKVF